MYQATVSITIELETLDEQKRDIYIKSIEKLINGEYTADIEEEINETV